MHDYGSVGSCLASLGEGDSSHSGCLLCNNMLCVHISVGSRLGESFSVLYFGHTSHSRCRSRATSPLARLKSFFVGDSNLAIADRGRRLLGEPSGRGGGQRGGGNWISIASVGGGAPASGTGGGRDGAADRGRCGVASFIIFGDLADCGRRRCGDFGVGALRVGGSFLASAGRRTRRRRRSRRSFGRSRRSQLIRRERKKHK